MTIASTVSKVSYVGNGSTAAFAIPFYFVKNEDVGVVLRGTDGNESAQTLTTDYTLSGAGNPLGGICTMTRIPETGETLVIHRDPAMVQETDYQENDAFPAQTHEKALDLLTMICQALSEKLDRAVIFQITSSVSGITIQEPEPGSILMWNGAGTGFENGPDATDIENAQANASTAALSAASATDMAGQAQTSASQAESSAQTASAAAEGLSAGPEPGNPAQNWRLGNGAFQDFTFLDGIALWNPGSLASGGGESLSVPVPGAEIGDFALVSLPCDIDDCSCSAHVREAGVAEVRLDNLTGAAVDLGSGYWRVRVMKRIPGEVA